MGLVLGIWAKLRLLSLLATGAGPRTPPFVVAYPASAGSTICNQPTLWGLFGVVVNRWCLTVVAGLDKELCCPEHPIVVIRPAPLHPKPNHFRADFPPCNTRIPRLSFAFFGEIETASMQSRAFPPAECGHGLFKPRQVRRNIHYLAMVFSHAAFSNCGLYNSYSASIRPLTSITLTFLPVYGPDTISDS